MKLYKLSNIADGYATIDFTGVNISSIVSTGDLTELNGKSFSWLKTESDENISDAPFYIGAFPIFKLSKVQSLLQRISVRTAKFSVDGEEYVAVSAPIIKGDVLNLNASKFRSFKSGKIMTVSSYVFKAAQYPPIFRFEQYLLYTFVNEELANALESCGLKQLIIEPCEVLS